MPDFISFISKWRIYPLLLVLISLITYCQQLSTAQLSTAEGTIIKNGQWWNGKEFLSTPLYIVEGRFSEKPPKTITQEIDAEGGYILPPFAEAHNHNIFPIDLESSIQNYIDQGVLYVMNQGNTCFSRDLVNDFVNIPASIDVAFANGGFTSANGHDVQLNENLLRRGVFPGMEKNDLPDDAYYIISTEEEIGEKWDRFLNCDPDFVKIFLGYSEDFVVRNGNPSYFGQSGINPSFIPAIVKIARANGLQTSCHVETANDFHIAVQAGVDIIAHLPGYQVQDTLNKSKYIIAEADAKEAKRRGIVVITTTRLNYSFQRRNEELYRFVDDIFKTNLSILKEAGVKIAVGSDRYGEVSVKEALNLQQYGLFSNRELINMWTSITPQAIFPNRKIGQIKAGYEANFLVLRGNPIENFEEVENAFLLVKKGIPLN